jgi:hypothetical protein
MDDPADVFDRGMVSLTRLGNSDVSEALVLSNRNRRSLTGI